MPSAGEAGSLPTVVTARARGERTLSTLTNTLLGIKCSGRLPSISAADYAASS